METRRVQPLFLSEGLSRAARDMASYQVVSLLVDDGVPSRGHRDNILNESYNRVGVAIGEHRMTTRKQSVPPSRSGASSSPAT